MSQQFVFNSGPLDGREYIDVNRTARILSVAISTVYSLVKAKKIALIDFRFHGKKRVLYQSIVDFCDELRLRHCIADRRQKLSCAYFRYRDEDLLPFPMVETMTSVEAAAILGYYATDAVLDMCEEGRFEAYQLVSKSPWRISKTSFGKYIEQIRPKSDLAHPRHKICSDLWRS